MSLFGSSKPTFDEYLLSQVEELKERLSASERLRNEELARHERKEAEFFQTQQDLVHTILILKGVPIVENDPETGQRVEVKPTPSTQRKTWFQITTHKTLESRLRAKHNERLMNQAGGQ